MRGAADPGEGDVRLPEGGRVAMPELPAISLLNLFLFVALATLLGWLLYIGKIVVLPLVVSLMLTYVLIGAVQGLRRLRFFRHMPMWLAYTIVVTIIGLSLALTVLVAFSNLRQIALSLPTSEDQLNELIAQVSAMIGLSNVPSLDTLSAMTLDRIDLAGVSLWLLSSVTSVGSALALIVTYVVFMVAERGLFLRRLDKVLPDDDERGAMRAVLDRINSQIVTYLSTKTMINVILGAISYVIMLLLGVENAVFWAFLIALFNYIPYVGSLIGVATVTLYVLVFRVDLAFASLTCVLLTIAQVYVGNYLEPKIMGQTLNLSPLVVLVALVVWSSLWGLPGAIIAVPMTSVVMIILAAFKQTRGISVLASADGDV